MRETQLTPIEIYAKLQAKWISLNNVKIGDKVKVTTSAKDHEQGWNNGWNDQMQEKIGRTLVVDMIYPDQGIHMRTGYSYPYFVLEKVGDTNKDVLQKVIETSAGNVILAKNNVLTINNYKFNSCSQILAIVRIVREISYGCAPIGRPSFEIMGWKFSQVDCEKMHRVFREIKFKE